MADANEGKILFAGPVGVGKTTSIAVLSDVPVIGTDAMASDMTVDRKAQTTVAMDYGILHLPGGGRLHLYGTPGQERFDFMWDILARGCLGLVLLLDATRPNPEADIVFYLLAFKSLLRSAPLVIGVTKRDINAQVPISAYHRWIATACMEKKIALFNDMVPVFEADGRQREDVKTLALT